MSFKLYFNGQYSIITRETVRNLLYCQKSLQSRFTQHKKSVSNNCRRSIDLPGIDVRTPEIVIKQTRRQTCLLEVRSSSSCHCLRDCNSASYIHRKIYVRAGLKYAVVLSRLQSVDKSQKQRTSVLVCKAHAGTQANKSELSFKQLLLHLTPVC